MVQYPIQERILIIKEYICTRNFLEPKKAFRIQFPVPRVPTKFTIHYCCQTFSVYGVCLSQDKGTKIHKN